MSTPIDPGHDSGAEGSPTIVEVAALTRRLRALSARGRHADPVERAAFLVDKNALLARIPDANTDADGAAEYANDDVAADEEGPVAPVYGPDDSYWWHPAGSARLDLPNPDVLPAPEQSIPYAHDLPEPGLDLTQHRTTVTGERPVTAMPEWMREQAAETAAAMAAETAPEPRVDDPGELAARVAHLHHLIHSGDAAEVPPHLDDTNAAESREDGAGWSR